MPTIAQLPTAASVTAQDEIPLSQAAPTRSPTLNLVVPGPVALTWPTTS